MPKSIIRNIEADQLIVNYLKEEHIEDRFYEFAQDLVNSYIKKVEDKYEVVDNSGEPYNENEGEMWYDEIRDYAMKCIFETIGEMYK